MKNAEIDEVTKLVSTALAKLRRNDVQLFASDVNERSITHKLAEYLQQGFSDWNVDCEYNRNLGDIKRLRVPTIEVRWDDLESKTVFPDIVVHKRGTKENLLVIEVKKSNNSTGDEYDMRKLRAYRREPLNYRFALFIKFDVGRDPVKPATRWLTSACH